MAKIYITLIQQTLLLPSESTEWQFGTKSHLLESLADLTVDDPADDICSLART